MILTRVPIITTVIDNIFEGEDGKEREEFVTGASLIIIIIIEKEREGKYEFNHGTPAPTPAPTIITNK